MTLPEFIEQVCIEAKLQGYVIRVAAPYFDERVVFETKTRNYTLSYGLIISGALNRRNASLLAADLIKWFEKQRLVDLEDFTEWEMEQKWKEI